MLYLITLIIDVIEVMIVKEKVLVFSMHTQSTHVDRESKPIILLIKICLFYYN
jgi:hypothetical protein